MADFDLLGDGLRKVLLAGIGALATGYEKSSELVDELVKKGEITVEQGKALNTELKRKVSETVDDAKKAAAEASEKVQHAFEVLGDNIPDNLRQAGQLRIDHVDKSLEELGKIAEPQITKDAIAGRIRRLLQLAEKTEKARRQSV